MRGVAAILASLSVWVIVTGRVPLWQPRWRISVKMIAAGMVAGTGAAVLTFGLLGSAVPAAAIGLLGASIPAAVITGRERAALQARLERWPDVLAHMRGNVGAGLTLPDATSDALRRAGGELGDFEDEIRRQVMFGEGFSAALATMRRELDDPVTDRIVATLAVAQRSGGHRVGEVLRSLQQSVADDLRLRSAHEAALTEQRWTAGVALIAPWALLVLSVATNPTAAATYDSLEGAVVIAVGFLATVTGWFLARRTARLSEPPRLFR
ncbi:MAG: hypothetical protein BMS9Abin17_0705 [Acidimicrobiia bacterium]|nr:MAG: hypothetical protein BMS9Abin17_0705 [Acidimicrobiia bacterium]